MKKITEEPALSAIGSRRGRSSRASQIPDRGNPTRVSGSPAEVTRVLFPGEAYRQSSHWSVLPYHHGDLRRALIETAMEMLAEERGWQFTLREVARRVGVSHAAPYKHFPDKASLLAELAFQGFEQLRRDVVASTATRPRSVPKEFQAAAAAYLRFGTSNPALYRLMFSAEAGDAASVLLNDRATRTMDVLLDILERGQRAGVFRRRPLEAQTSACWAQMHGITMLAIEGLLLPEKVGPTPLQGALKTLLEGLEVSPE